MKKLLLLLSVLLFAVGCSNGETAGNDETDNKGDTGNEVTDSQQENEDSGILTEVGQKINDKRTNSTVELMAIKDVNETIDLDPVKLTIDDIKIIRISNIKSGDYKSYLSQFTDKEEFDYIQIMYKIENTIDDNVEINYPIEHVVLNTGEQIDTNMNDIMLHPDNGGEFFGKVIKNTGISLIINNSNVEDIETIKLITGDVWEKDGGRLIGEIEKTYNIK